MINSEAGKNTGQLRIEGIVGLTTTVIGIVQERLAMVFDAVAQGVGNGYHTFRQRQTPANNITAATIQDKRHLRRERVAVVRMGDFHLHAVAVTNPDVINRK
ncbi:Uncharacterised protein [Klebsiella pneumoniae]|nr:Uncharacterised protein [Klebsiella pneumoniae]SWA88319.1 Uncharacterised protein [Klebsiella pneumoniae]